MWNACSGCIPDIEVIWYSIECTSGTASITVTVVVQCDGSQGDSCGEYEQQLPSIPAIPRIVIGAEILLLSNVVVSQFEMCSITMCVAFWKVNIFSLIAPTVGTGTLSSGDIVIIIGIL